MIESLGENRRQDRVLHGIAKALNLIAAVFLYPAWIVGQRLVRPVRWLLSLIGDGQADRQQSSFNTRPQTGERSQAQIVRLLKDIPANPRGPRRYATAKKGLAELCSFLFSQKRQTVNFGYSYPAQFDYKVIAGADGERFAAMVGLHKEPRPGLVIVHGFMSNKLFDYVREPAICAFYEWGFNVAVIDQRGFGQSEMLSEAPNTFGWKEGEDIICAARHLKQCGSKSVGVLGFSLGGGCSINASAEDGAESVLDGGVMAINPPADTKAALEYISTKPRLGHPFWVPYHLFRIRLKSRVRNLAGAASAAEFHDMLYESVLPYYGISDTEIFRLSSPMNQIGHAKVPLLVLHADDDMFLPVEHARKLTEAGERSENVHVWTMPWGGHAAFDALDRRWTHSVLRTYFEYWAGGGRLE